MSRKGRHAAQMATRKQRLFCFLVAIAVIAWALYFHLEISRSASLMMLVFWLTCDAVVAFYLISFAIGRRFIHFPVARGFVVGLVPTYEDSTESVHSTIRSMLNQTRPPDVIHVVDDGSKNPPAPFDHPKVVWHRKPNGGKRDAQAYVLRQIDPDTVDYFWTIDGDSEVEPTALEHMLRAMSNKKIMACTGMILVRNYRQNFLTRITDLNIGTSCLEVRTSRSLLGAVETTSGALALYRKEIFYDNLEDYLTSGTNGDDRRLTMYAAMRGDIVVVNEARVHTDMPETVSGMFWQRLRWGKSAWQAIPFWLINLSPKQIVFPMMAMVMWALIPITFTWLIVSITVNGHYQHALIASGAYLLIRYGETAQYMISRPGMPNHIKFFWWLVLTPIELLVNLFVTRPAKYWALTKLKQRGWHTRGNAHAEEPADTPMVTIPHQRHDETMPLRTVVEPEVYTLYDPSATQTTELPIPGNLRQEAPH